MTTKSFKIESEKFRFLSPLFSYVSKTNCDINGDYLILELQFSGIINKSGLHFGRGGSHIWFSRKSNNERIGIIYYKS